jgi:hypothetical protein
VKVGYLALNAPDKRVPNTWSSPTDHDRRQRQRLALLPNVLYTDGQERKLYRSGQLAGAPIDGDFEQAVAGFVTWAPELPSTVAQLVGAVADLRRLCVTGSATQSSERLRRQYRGSSGRF